MTLAGCAVFVAALLVFAFSQRRRDIPVTPQDTAAPQHAEVSFGPVQTAAATPPARTPFDFRHVVMNTAGDAPEICFHFSQKLNMAAEAHYADYVALAPAARVSVQTAGDNLCLGGLAYGTDYTVTLKKGLPSETGMRLEVDQSVPVSLGDRPPLVDISGDGFILPRAVAHGITIQTVNVKRVRIHVMRLSDRLLPASSARRGVSGINLEQTRIPPYELRNLLDDSTSMIWTGTMDVPQDHNRTVATAFPLSEVIKPGMVGAYLVVAEDDAHALADSKWITRGNNDDDDDRDYQGKAAHWVIATDIALTTFSGTGGLDVQARSLTAATPLGGISLDLLSVGQDVLGEANTDAQGMVHFAPGLLRGTGAAAAGKVVAHGPGGDFTMLDLSRPAFDFSDRGVTGRPSPAPLQAFLYTERGIYRPGQNVELMALFRDRLGGAVDRPLTLVLRRPNGMEAKRFSLPAQQDAGFHQTIPLTATAARGTWTVEALADPAGAAIGRVSFEVQDYVPQQLKVTLAPIAAALLAGEKLSLDVQGDFLYGAPAAGLHGQADLRLTRDPDPVPAAKGWQFGLADEQVEDKTQTVDLPDADAKGHVHTDVALDMPKTLPQTPLKVVITAGLFEPSGRQVNDTAEAKLRTGAVLIGLHPRFSAEGAAIDQAAAIDIRAFAADGTPVARPGLAWRVVEEQRLFDWFEEDGGWHWHYHIQDHDIEAGRIDATAANGATIARHYDWGYYRLIVTDTVSGATSSQRFTVGWQSSANADVPDKLDIAADKPVLPAGGTTSVHIQAPFAGHARIVVANDRVIETREVEVAKGSNDVQITQNADWGAGAYVLASLYRPLRLAGAHLPARAVGVAWIATDAGPRRLAVDIGAPPLMRPQTDVTVPIHVGNVPAGEQAYVTLAAVDEGILQLTRFITPDPVGFLFGKRALGIAMRDDYGKLLDGSADPGQISGGDEGIGGAGLPVVSTRTVAIFNGPVALDADGNAKITLQPGDFEGQLRLMAVAYTAHGVGAAQKTLIVRDPVVADIAVPRFLATGDTAQLAVTLNDTDGAAGTYKLAVDIGGAARAASQADFATPLEPGKRFSASLAIAAEAEGVADIDAKLTGPNGLAVHRSWHISVRTAHAPITLIQTAWQAKGAPFAISPDRLKPFVPGSLSVSLGYSGFGGIDVPSLLQSLYRYPYGCTEQLSSSAFPLLYANDPALLGKLPHDQAVHERVQQAIDTILDRQDESGEFGLWRANDGEASTWVVVYAVDFLTHAKEAGFDVPDSALKRAATFLRRAVNGELHETAYRYYAQGTAVTRAYANYVLARLGRADLGDLRRTHDDVAFVSKDGFSAWRNGDDTLEPLALGHLAGALSLMGDHARAADAFQKALENLGNIDARSWPAWWFDWSYSTPLRDTAGLIAIAADTGQEDVLKPLLDRLSRADPDPARLNTQEQASLLAAAHALNKGIGTLTLTVNGKPAAYSATPALSPTPADIAAGYSVVNTSGRALWRTLAITGGPREAAPALSAGYTLDRIVTTLQGKAFDLKKLRQNDRVIVELHGFLTGDSLNHRTVIVDMLPAGLEIEAPIVKDTEYAFLGPLSNTRVREARDDRFVAALDFGEDLVNWRYQIEETNDDKPHLENDEFRVAYVARAITPGHFTIPEAVVQDMYRPAFMARTAAASLDIEKR